jgi:Glycosyltransferase family 87
MVVLGLIQLFSYRNLLSGPFLTQNDFTPNYVAAKAWLHGENPYQELPPLIRREFGPNVESYALRPMNQRNSHPPFLIVLVSPLTRLPFRAARSIWLSLGVASVALAVGLCCRTLMFGWPTTVLLMIAAFALSPVTSDVSNGQINGFILLLLVGAWRASKDGKREAVGGALLGVAIALKLYPVILIVPLLRERRHRTVLVAVAVAASLSIAGALGVGLSAVRTWRSLAAPNDFSYWASSPLNASLPGLAVRWLTRNPWQRTMLDQPALAALLAIALVAGCIFGIARTRARVSGDLFWAAVPWMVVASPLAWNHYVVLALPLLILSFRRWPVLNRTERVAIIVGWVLATETPVPVELWLFGGHVSRTSLASYLAIHAMFLYGLIIVGITDLGWPGRRPSRAAGKIQERNFGRRIDAG